MIRASLKTHEHIVFSSLSKGRIYRSRKTRHSSQMKSFQTRQDIFHCQSLRDLLIRVDQKSWKCTEEKPRGISKCVTQATGKHRLIRNKRETSHDFVNVEKASWDAQNKIRSAFSKRKRNGGRKEIKCVKICMLNTA